MIVRKNSRDFQSPVDDEANEKADDVKSINSVCLDESAAIIRVPFQRLILSESFQFSDVSPSNCEVVNILDDSNRFRFWTNKLNRLLGFRGSGNLRKLASQYSDQNSGKNMMNILSQKYSHTFPTSSYVILCPILLRQEKNWNEFR